MSEPSPNDAGWAAVGPLLSDAQMCSRLRVSTDELDGVVAAGRLLVLVERAGARRFPAWQLDEEGRRLDALIAAHRMLVHQGAMSPWSAASWCVHEHPELGLSPRAWAHGRRDPQRLMLVALRDAARAAL